MGCHPNLTSEKYPKQSEDVGAKVDVCFHYDTSKQFPGKFIRDDDEEPFLTVIQLEDGRIVLGSECQYSPR